MGVHGLTGLLKQLGIDDNSDESVNLSHNSSTLAIDGNGLIFHLFRLAYYRHYKNVTSSPTKKDLQTQLLLPSLLPLSLADEVTTRWLSDLTTKHGVHLKIYFDGPNQYMKRHVKRSRAEQRLEQWSNVRELCMHGTLPESSRVSKFKSSARRQAREYEGQMNGSGGDAEAEMYLSMFPLSSLVMEQIERSIQTFEEMSPVLPCGSIQIIQCDGEADAEVARASANDTSGMTYALASDSDYLIYGYSKNKLEQESFGEVKYLQFQQIDPRQDDLRVCTVLNRNEVAVLLDLPYSSAMVDLSILLGNDYTVPFVKQSDNRKEYWESIQWCKDGEEDCGDGERLPPESELNWRNVQAIVDHVAEKVGNGLRLTSDNENLKLAIDFSYALYSFDDISNFPSTSPDEEQEESEEDETSFPSLPSCLDLSLAQEPNQSLVDSCLSPILSYKSNVEPQQDELEYVKDRHIDAFRMTLELMAESERHIEPPKQKLRWEDMQSMYVLERCLLAAIEEDSVMPYRLFERSIFHSLLESISLEDFPLDNELVSKDEKAFIEEATTVGVQEGNSTESVTLPIDEHKENILNTIKTQRVTIIHGETGCGKSSRLPCFLLRADPPQPTRAAPEVKMIVSQPRRIAAKALAERVRSAEPDLQDKIGLRMGHGMREHETSKTRCWFVTTGYVVRLLANHPSWFDSHTHLIIDEVHERSVDTDILCLLCRRLLKSHPSIRLVLMSATLAAELYSQYFGSPEPPIHVGVRRFPINEYFVEDLSTLFSFQSKEKKLANQIFEECEKTKCRSAPSGSNMERLYKMAAHITASVARKSTRSSILIFVPGMSDIEAISELIENLKVPRVTFNCLPIHSDVPFEDQMRAFDPVKEDEIKCVIATNAAESSLTLPDVDHVICLGLCKQITYNPASHRQMLVPTWISKASATQRAGRTGRVRQGNVYRLYSKNCLNKYMSPFEMGEMVRIPLDQVILSLREMLGEAVTPVLLDSIEPPDLGNIERSFKSLFDSNFISDPSDHGEITSLGQLVVALGIDLTVGAFVGLGIQFGVAAEAIELAAILSFPKTPWAITSPMYHDTSTFNDITSRTFHSRCYYDAGLLSEPLSVANLLHDYAESKDKSKFIKKHCLSGTRIRHLLGTVQSLRQRVADYLNVKPDILEVDIPPNRLHPSKLNILRILQVWVFHDSMILHDTSKRKVEFNETQLCMNIDGPPIKREHILQILDESRDQFEIFNAGKISQSIRFDSSFLEDSGVYFEKFDASLVSFVLEKGISFASYTFEKQFKVIVPSNIWNLDEVETIRNTILGNSSARVEDQIFQHQSGNGNQRGRRGRACGMWHLATFTSSRELANNQCHVTIITSQLKSKKKSIFDKEFQAGNAIQSTLFFYIAKTKKKAIVSAEISGIEKITDIDLRDMFAAPDLVTSVTKSTSRQTVVFSSIDGDKNHDSTTASHCLLVDAPEGARLMTVLASGRRKDHFVRFVNGENDTDFVDMNIPRQLGIQGKWKRQDSKAMVYVPENSPPMAAIPMTLGKSFELFGCCANALDLSGGARRVEGITLMPPGRLFSALAMLSFGFHPRNGLSFDEIDQFDMQEILHWIFEEDIIPSAELAGTGHVAAALDFNESCMDLGEVLECQPDKIRALCAIFDGVWGSMVVWDGYETTLSEANAALRQKINYNINVDNEQKEFPVSAANTKKMVDRKHENTTTLKSKSRAFTCEGCSESFSEQLQYAKHIDKCLYVNFSCSNCSKLFRTWISCRTHRAICCPNESGSRKMAITAVSPTSEGESINFITGISPTSAVENNASQTLQRWACRCCGETFVKKKACTKHIKECGKNKKNKKNVEILVFVCSGCQAQFVTHKECQLHTKKSCKKTSESKPEVSPETKPTTTPVYLWECSKCKKIHPKKKKCLAHIRRSQCGHIGNSTESLVPVRKISCPGCNLSFAMPKECQTHMKTCSTNTNQMKIQPNVSPLITPESCRQIYEKWACEGCSNCFAKRNECSLHMRQCKLCMNKKMTPKLVFPCPLCNAQFAKSKECKSHVCQLP